MKKTILFALLCGFALSISAQNKKELLEKVSQLETQNAVLTATIGEKTAQIESLTTQLAQANATIATLQQTIGQLQATNAQLQAQVVPEKPKSLTDSIVDFLLQFYKAGTVDERAKYVMEPSRVKPLMQKHYNGRIRTCDRFTRYSGDGINSNYVGAIEFAESLYALEVKIPGSDEWIANFILRTPEGFKLDWEATTFSGMATASTMKQHLNQTFTTRFNVRAIDSFSNTNHDSWHDMSCYINDDFYQGYFERSMPFANRLIQMADSKQPDVDEGFSIIVKAHMELSESGSYIIIITDLVNETPSMYKKTRLPK